MGGGEKKRCSVALSMWEPNDETLFLFLLWLLSGSRVLTGRLWGSHI